MCLCIYSKSFPKNATQSACGLSMVCASFIHNLFLYLQRVYLQISLKKALSFWIQNLVNLIEWKYSWKENKLRIPHRIHVRIHSGCMILIFFISKTKTDPGLLSVVRMFVKIPAKNLYIRVELFGNVACELKIRKLSGISASLIPASVGKQYRSSRNGQIEKITYW